MFDTNDEVGGWSSIEVCEFCRLKRTVAECFGASVRESYVSACERAFLAKRFERDDAVGATDVA